MSRLHGTKLGYDPDDQQAMRIPGDDWNNAWKEADKKLDAARLAQVELGFCSDGPVGRKT